MKPVFLQTSDCLVKYFILYSDIMTGFIGIHIGAGNHSDNLKPQYDVLCKTACTKAMDLLRNGKSAIEVICLATKVLEDSELTNTGIGSNLTWDGTVECDASLMDGETLNFGGIGAVPNVKNPILAARKVFDDQLKSLSLQRVSPCLMVGEGGRKIAEEVGLIVEPNSLLTNRTIRAHRKYRRKVEKIDKELEENRSSDDIIEENRLDTVGAVCADLKGNVAASCSSGGIALKQSGRVGQAAIFGAGCWAQRTGLNKGIATSVSGTGEDLIRTSLAKEVALAISKSDLQSNAVHDTIKSSFLESPFLTRNSEKLCGIIALEVSENSGEFIWAHTTNTMGISYMSTNHKHPKVKISKLPLGVPAGSTVAVEGVLW